MEWLDPIKLEKDIISKITKVNVRILINLTNTNVNVIIWAN